MFAVDALAMLPRSTAGEPLQKELVTVLEGNTYSMHNRTLDDFTGGVPLDG